MTSPLVSYTKNEKVAFITLNRPPANAYNLAFYTALLSYVQQANADADVGAVIINSSSEKFFCAGADIKEFQQNTTAQNQAMVRKAQETLAAIHNSGKLFIAQIAGHALGGGLELAMGCDLRFAAQGTYKLGLPEIKLGLIPGNGGTQRLLRLVGVSRALELLASGDAFAINDAEKWGLINRLVEREALAEHCFHYARTIANGPLLALSATKKALQQGAELSLADGLALEKNLCDPLYDSHDGQEGFNAFVEKRAPQFNGR